MKLDKEWIRLRLSQFAYGTGLYALGRIAMPEAGAQILMGHRIAADDEGYLQGLDPAWLEEHVAYLTRHYEVISLTTLVQCYENRSPVPRRSVVLTLDDGFRDNLEHGLPVFERHKVPATVFMVTRSASTGELPWPQRLGFLFRKTKAASVLLPTVREKPFSLDSPRQREVAYRAIMSYLKQLARVDRDTLIENLAAEFGLQPPTDQMLSWADLRLLMAHGIEVGAHTYSHPWLTQVHREEARSEIERSRDDLREHLGISRPFFCFPGGSRNPQLVKLARSLGFCGTFQSRPGSRVHTLESAEPFALSRLGWPNAPVSVLATELDGIAGLARKFAQPLRTNRGPGTA